ncbi:MAG: hypothetical protein ACR2M1_02640 [Gemmatimonadaceae bacterium]
MRITLRVAGNHGINAFVTGGTTEVTSDAAGSAGIATFPKLRVTKAGGYTIQAVGSLSGNPTSSVLSNLFNVQGQ